MTREDLLEIIYRAEREQASELDLSEYEIEQLPPEIAILTSLQILIVRGLKELTGEIAKLRNLTWLYLNSNELTELPDEIAKLKNLTRLYLNSNQLESLPEKIFQLTNLRELNLSSNLLSRLSGKIGHLRNLSTLYLNSNQLDELPDEIGQLRNLRVLYLGANHLRKLPGGITQLKNLRELNLSSNQLREVPREIFQLGELSLLDLNSNELGELPREIAHLEKLEELNLSSNHLSGLPPEIARLRHLAELNLSSNDLRELPAEIARLGKITRLYLSFNRLREVPREIAQFEKLNILDLSANELEKLPPEIAQLGNLTVLYLDSNHLSEIPKEIIKLDKLIHLDLNKNPLSFPPLEIASQGLSAVRDYLKKSGKGGQTLYEGKILIVGQGGVGKTCLANRLLQNKYVENQPSTEGIDIRSWKIEAPDGTGTRMTLNVWDFGGQEIYHATHQFFLTQRSLYVLVWDARQEEEFSRIDYWLNIIRSFAEDSPIMIVMNKADERTKDLNLKNLRDRCPQITGSEKVSARNGAGIDSLRQFIADQAWNLPLMGTFWPSSWLNVRRILKATSKYHVSYKSYLKVCGKLDIDEGEARTLSRYLHDLGILLHFQNDILLKNTLILKPEWGTDAVYKVLDARIVRKRNGVLYGSDLPKIWKNRTLYPKDKYPTILRLMVNFELAFPFDSNSSTNSGFIVAEFLPTTEPDYEWKPVLPLEFEYHYEFLPAGVMTRVIVRMNEFLMERGEEKLCWREGAYFKYGETQAMVRVNTYVKIAVIQTRGPRKQEFLSIIRSHFEAIHQSISKLRFKESIPCRCMPDCKYGFDYNFLLKCEEKGIKEVICEENADYSRVRTLLDRIEKHEFRQERRRKKEESKHRIPLIEIPVLPPHQKKKLRLSLKTFILILTALIAIMGSVLIWMGGKL